MDTTTAAATTTATADTGEAHKDHIARKGSELLDIIKGLGASDELSNAIASIEHGLEWVMKHFAK